MGVHNSLTMDLNAASDEKVNVLVVDDHPENLLAVEASLGTLDENVVCADSGPDALRKLLLMDFACILLDVQMPEMDGFETALLIRQRERSRHTPIIFLTAIHRTPDHVDQGYALGAVDYLFKPIQPEILRSKVSVFVDLYRRTREIQQQAERVREAEARVHAAQLAEMEEYGRRIQEINRKKNAFLADMSHELRTPLNAIIGFTELMYEGQVPIAPEAVKSYLGYILNGAMHLLHLVDDVLDLVKVESGRFEFHPERIVMSQLVGEVFDLLAPLASKKRLEMVRNLSSDVSTVYLDPGKLKQVLYNFLSNALKFTPDGGTVTLRITPESSRYFRLEVHDTGIGIRDEDMNKLFQEFQQLHTSLRNVSGSGLGLALTRRIVEAQGGTVGATSTPGKGSRFYAIMPMVADQGDEQPPPRIAPASVSDVPDADSRLWNESAESPADLNAARSKRRGARRLKGERVLIIEDNPGHLELARVLLAEEGCEVREACDAEHALTVLDTFSPQLILMDLNLPGMTGLDLAQALRSDPRTQGTIILGYSAEALNGDQQRAVRAGFDGFLVKPVDISSLRNAVAGRLIEREATEAS